jgi:hypothetical protein
MVRGDPPRACANTGTDYTAATSRVEGRNCRAGAVEPIDAAREGMLDQA